ncbi:hypothetical protein CcaCcLH18_10852 [Colletotrichum camelliae]|nr:hypothetical protein CcaCcLH18_10852 [Colletotrichum camelliae]
MLHLNFHSFTSLPDICTSGTIATLATLKSSILVLVVAGKVHVCAMQRDQAPDGYRNLPFAPAKRRLSASENRFLDPASFQQEYDESPKRACTPERFFSGQQTTSGEQLPTTFSYQADDVGSGSQAGYPLTFGDFLDSQAFESQDLNPLAISGLMNPVTDDPDRMEPSYQYWPIPVPEFATVDNLELSSQYEWGLGNADMFTTPYLGGLPICDEDVSDSQPQFSLESRDFQPGNDILGEPFPQTMTTAEPGIPLSDASNHAGKHADAEVLSNEAETEADKIVPPSPSPSEPSYDTCFEGVHVSGNRGSKKQQMSEPKEVNLSPSHGTVMLTDKTSKRYCGLMSRDAADTVLSLLVEHKLHITATLEPSGTISALIYGREAQGTQVGEFLSDHDCFLQHPDLYESTTYNNPQWLLRPGSDFKAESIPRIPDVSVSTVLNTHKKSKVVEILDSAAGPSNFNRIDISSLIVTKLKEHQEKALSMMIEKESGILRDPVFPSLWVEVDSTETSGLRYLNTVSNARIVRRPNVCLGGLLADDMGLGKTLTVLSLIASSLDKNPHFQTQHGHTTLVVAPLSNQINLVLVYHGNMRHGITSFDEYDIVLTNYDTVRAESKFSLEEINTSPLRLAAWARIVLDEAHVIRNRSSRIFAAIQNLKATYRWCVTGTPIQNSIEDLGSLVGFLRVQPYDDAKRFADTFVRPIKSGNQSGWGRLQALIQDFDKSAIMDPIFFQSP